MNANELISEIESLDKSSIGQELSEELLKQVSGGWGCGSKRDHSKSGGHEKSSHDKSCGSRW